MYMFIVLFLVVYLLQFFFKRAKTVCLQEPSTPFCGVLKELRVSNFTILLFPSDTMAAKGLTVRDKVT